MFAFVCARVCVPTSHVYVCVLKHTLQVALEDVEAPAGGVVLLLVHTQVPLAEHGRGTVPGCRLQVRGQEGEVQGRGPGRICTRACDKGGGSRSCEAMGPTV